MSEKHIPLRYIHGSCSPENLYASDVNLQGLVAFGCRNLVIIVDSWSQQLIQTLSFHENPVILVKWWQEVQPLSPTVPFCLKIASVDNSGLVCIWDVKEAQHLTYFNVEVSSRNTLVHLEWMNDHEGCRDSLAVLTSQGNLAVWNSGTGSCIWKHKFLNSAISMELDPFDYTRIMIRGSDHLLLLEDATPYKAPNHLQRHYLRSLPIRQDSHYPIRSSNITLTSDVKLSTIPPVNKQDDVMTPHQNLISVKFSKFHRDLILLLYKTSIIFIHLDGGQTIYQIFLDKGQSSFLDIITCRQRDAIYGFHENGTLSFRLQQFRKNFRRTKEEDSFPNSPNPRSTDLLVPHSSSRALLEPAVNNIEPTNSNYAVYGKEGFGFEYELKCRSDVMRDSTKNIKQVQMKICLTTESRLILIMPESNLQTWELTPRSLGIIGQSTLAVHQSIGPFHNPDTSDLQVYPVNSLATFLTSEATLIKDEEYRQNCHIVTFKFCLVSLYTCMLPNPTCIKMGPPMTTKNRTVYHPLLAIGNLNGKIQIIDLHSHSVVKTYSVMSSPVKGIIWTSLHSILSFGYSESGNNGLVRNELNFLDLNSGCSVNLRKGSLKEPDYPIESIKMSVLKQYFIVVFNDKPIEYWDLLKLCQLKILSSNFPLTTAVEWSPANPNKNKMKLGDLSKGEGDTYYQEFFIMADQNSVLYQIIAEGSTLREVNRFSPETSIGVITCITWKNELVAIGDNEGNVTLWETKSKSYKVIPTHMGILRYIKFAPGKGNFKLLIQGRNSIEIRDVMKEGEICGQLKGSNDDLDWANPDKLCILNKNSSIIRVCDVAFLKSNTPYYLKNLIVPIFCPQLMESKSSLILRTLLQHQKWLEHYDLRNIDFTQLPSSTSHDVEVNVKLIPDVYLQLFMSTERCCAEKCCLAAALFGDWHDYRFWLLATYHLRRFKEISRNRSASDKQEKNATEKITSSRECLMMNDTGVNNPSLMLHMKSLSRSSELSINLDCFELELSEDLLCDFSSYQLSALRREDILEQSCRTIDQARKCAANLIQVNEADRAVQLLLETDSTDPNYHVDCLRACLVATIRSSGASQSTIKLVATSLIANGYLEKGVELLCLINKGLDACRYLQTYGKWSHAAHLAKSTLTLTDCHEVFMRWGDHLTSPMANRQQGVLVYLSVYEFQKVLEMLYAMRYFIRAALFAEACIEFDVLDLKNLEIKSLVEAIFLEYARIFFGLEFLNLAEYYASKAGDNGQRLLEEFKEKNK